MELFEKKERFEKGLKKLFRYIKPYAFFAIVSPLMMMGEVLADLCLPYLMSFIVDYGILENGLQSIREDGGFAYWVMTTLLTGR